MSRVTDKALQTSLEMAKLYMDLEMDKLHVKIPAKLSQLENDNHTVTDESYVHTDNNYSDADKAVAGSLPATILTNPNVIDSGGETYLNISYDTAELVDGAYSTSTKTVTIPAADAENKKAGVMSAADKAKLDAIEEGANNYVLPAASATVRGGVMPDTAWQAPTLDSEDADGKNVPLEMANESSADGILKPACKVYVDDEPTKESNRLILSGAVCTAIDKAKRAVFIDLWDQACYQFGGYKPDEAPNPAKPFLLNGFWFSYEEAVTIYNQSFTEHRYDVDYGYKGCWLRTVLPIKLNSLEIRAAHAFESSKLERISFTPPNYDNRILVIAQQYMFAGCGCLEEVLTDRRIVLPYGNQTVTDMFKGCSKLREIRFYSAKTSFDIHWSPLLSLASVQSFIPPAAAPTPCTITVHPDVYAKLTGDKTNEAAAALTEEEAAAWQQIVVDAAAMNFSFATV